MDLLFLTFVVLLCWIIYLILQWTKSVDPSKDGTMLYVPQKTDVGVPKDTNFSHKEMEETQAEKIEKEELEEEEEVEFEEERFQPEAEKVIAELRKDEEEKDENEKEEGESVKEREKWHEDFLSYDEQVTKDEFDVRVAEMLIRNDEMGVAQEGVCDECSEEPKGECKGEKDTECCSQNEDKVEESGQTKLIVVNDQVTSEQNLRNDNIVEERPYQEVDPAHPAEESSIKVNDVLEHKENTEEKSEEITVVENTIQETELTSPDEIKIGNEDELRSNATLNRSFTSEAEDEPDNLDLGYNINSSGTDVLSQCINTVILENETKHLEESKKKNREENETELSTEHEKHDQRVINKEEEILTKSIDNEEEDSEIFEENKEEKSEDGEEEDLLSKRGKEGERVVESETNEKLKLQTSEKSKEDSTDEEDLETKIVTENKELILDENKDETEEKEHILKEDTIVEEKDEIEIEDKELISIEKEVEEAEHASKEAVVREEKDDAGNENKEELIFKCQLLPILNFKEQKDEAELMSKQTTNVEDKDEIGIDDKEEFLSKENKNDSFLQILKDLNEAESPKGIKEAIELLEDDDDEVFKKSRENEEISKEEDDESETLEIKEHNGSKVEDIFSKEESDEIPEETNVTEEIIEDTNVVDKVLEENKQESKIVEDLKETETEKDDKYATNITDIRQSESLVEKEIKLMKDSDETEIFEKDEEQKTKGQNEEEAEEIKCQTEISENINDTKLLENGKAETEISVDNEKDELRVTVVTENIKEETEEKGYTEDHRKDEEKTQDVEKSTFTEVESEEIEAQEESKILKDLTETETSTNDKETETSNIDKDKTDIANTEGEKLEKNSESNSSQQEFLSKFKEADMTDIKDSECGNKILNFKSQKEFRDFHSSEIENKENSNSVNKTIIITQEGDYVHNINEEIEISEVIGKEFLHQQKIEYTEVADEEEVLYRNVVKCGEEEFVEEFQTKNEIFNEKSCTSSVVTNEEISSSGQTTSTTITKVINLSYTSEECSTENIEIRTIIGDQGNLIPMTDSEQFKNINIGLLKDRLSSESPLKEKISTFETVNVENVSKDGITEFKKPVGGVYLFGGEELMNKIKSRKLIVDGYEKEQHENGEEWRLSKLNKGTDEETSKATSVSSSTKTTTTTQMRNQKSQQKQDIKQIHLASNAYDKTDAIPVLSASVNQPTIKEASSTQFSESHFQDGFTMTSHNGKEGEIISEIPTFQTESTLIHLNKDRNKGPVRRRKPEKSRDDI